MALEPKTGRIEVDFNADAFRLTLLLSKEQAGALNLQPGKKEPWFSEPEIFSGVRLGIRIKPSKYDLEF